MGRLVLVVLVEGCVCAGCAPLSLQGAQMPGSHWGTRLVTPPSPFSLPTSLSPSLTHCGSLSTFPTRSALVCGEGAFDIHNLVQRRSRSPESLYGFHGNRLVQRTWCSDGGERETYSKNRAPQVWQELDQLPSRGAGRGWARLWGPYRRSCLSPTHWVPPSEAAQLSLWLLAGCCFSHGPSG